jgi:CRISPR/Cas system-associated endonuclease/helicase Cas3
MENIMTKYEIIISINDVDDLFFLADNQNENKFITNKKEVAIKRAEEVYNDIQKEGIKGLKISVVVFNQDEAIKVFRNYNKGE